MWHQSFPIKVNPRKMCYRCWIEYKIIRSCGKNNSHKLFILSQKTMPLKVTPKIDNLKINLESFTIDCECSFVQHCFQLGIQPFKEISKY